MELEVTERETKLADVRLRSGSRIDQTGRAFLEPHDVMVTGTHHLQRDTPTGHDRNSGSWVEPFLDFRVSVGKRDSAGAVMIACREIPPPQHPRPSRVIPRHIYCEKAIVDSVFALIHHDKRFRGRGNRHVGQLFHDLETTGAPEAVWSVQPTVHRYAAHPWIDGPPVTRGALVSRTFPHSEGLMIWPQMTFLKKNCVRIVTSRNRILQPPLHPVIGRCRIDVVRRQFAFVVVGVHVPRKTDLFQIIDALDGMGLGFRLRESREKHAGQNRNDRDNDE